MAEQQLGARTKPPEGPSEDLVMAAIERAVRHRAADAPSVPAWAILEHLDVPRRSGAARHVRAVLVSLAQAARVEPSRAHGVEVWALTDAGRRRLQRLRRAGSIPPLPESPQHREWRQANTAAAQEAARFASILRERLGEAVSLLDADPPPHSDAWLELADTLRGACRRLGSSIHCLYEWPEPTDELADVDERLEPGDEDLAPAVRARRRTRRTGRRNVRLWREAD